MYVNTAIAPNLKLWGLFFLMHLSTLRIPKITANKTLIVLGYSHKSTSVLYRPLILKMFPDIPTDKTRIAAAGTISRYFSFGEKPLFFLFLIMSKRTQ